jgi:hypothetical protein
MCDHSDDDETLMDHRWKSSRADIDDVRHDGDLATMISATRGLHTTTRKKKENSRNRISRRGMEGFKTRLVTEMPSFPVEQECLPVLPLLQSCQIVPPDGEAEKPRVSAARYPSADPNVYIPLSTLPSLTILVIPPL